MISIGGEHCWQDDEGVFSLRSIGTSLGRIPRFTGHTELVYPVLAHALTAAVLCEPKWSIYALIHDATEATMNDVATPWKTQQHAEVEHMLYERICKHYGVPWPIPEEGQAEVDRVDRLCLVNEAYYLRHSAPGSVARGQEPDQGVMDVVAYHHDLAMAPMDGHPLPAFFHAEIAGPIFEDAFKSYLIRSVEAGLEGVDFDKAGVDRNVKQV